MAIGILISIARLRPERRRSTLGNLGPVEFETQVLLASDGVHQTGSRPITSIPSGAKRGRSRQPRRLSRRQMQELLAMLGHG